MRLLAAIVLAVGLAGCITPTIPIPPPDPTMMEIDPTIPIPPPEPGTTYQWTFTYPATSLYANGTAYIFDINEGQGVIQQAKADGSIGPTMQFPAMLGDNVDVTVQLEQQTASTCVVLQVGHQDPNQYCQ
ncbi:MAG TPA: hypothetical protein VMJ10_00700 [Kofleriaceae bacterium]|nr:hypothetical protein [Kofleriaceae bacterium]